jgi:hypothetical protein
MFQQEEKTKRIRELLSAAAEKTFTLTESELMAVISARQAACMSAQVQGEGHDTLKQLERAVELAQEQHALFLSPPKKKQLRKKTEKK